MKKLNAYLHRCGLLLIVFVFLLSVPGYPAQGATRTSYLVQAGSAAQAAQLVEQYGGIVDVQLGVINGVRAELTPADAEALLKEPGIRAVAADPVVGVVSDGAASPVAGTADIPAADYSDVSGTDLVWGAGITGQGISVAILDTGIGRQEGVMKGLDGSYRIIGWKDVVTGKKAPFDDNGHGTHIAGIIANSQIGADGEWDGIAPGVNLVGVRVLDENGHGTYGQVIEGIQWVIDHQDQYNIKVMNLSLVADVYAPYWADLLDEAVTRAWAAGITVIAAAGNGGPGAMTVGVPGNNPYVITVGAFTDHFTPDDWNDDSIAPFSAAGPTLDGFVKPDVVAPGAHIVSTMLPSTEIAKLTRRSEGDFAPATQVTSQYYAMAGTSQATAVVSGIAALILSANPDLTPDEVKFRITATAIPWADPVTQKAGYSIWQQGYGRVNAPDAVLGDMTTLVDVVDQDYRANKGMDINADLSGLIHYQGFSYYDPETGEFRLQSQNDLDQEMIDSGFGAWSGGFGAWSGGFGAWSGGFGAWSGGFGAWSGGFGAWSGGFGAWSGGFGAWSGGFGAWSGGFGAWSGGFGAWSGSEPWAGSVYSQPEFVANYINPAGQNIDQLQTTIDRWVPEP